LMPPALAVGLQSLGVPIDRGDVVGGMVIAAMIIVTGGAVFGIAVSVAGGVVGSAGVAIAFSIIGSMVGTVVGSVVSGVVIGIAFGMAVSVIWSSQGGVLFGRQYGVAGGIVFGGVVFLTLGWAGSLILGLEHNAIFSLVASMAVVVTLSRLTDYLLLVLPSGWAWSRAAKGQTWLVSRVVYLPLPGVQRRLEAWLAQDWSAGVHDVNQLLAYTSQFIPAVRAVNAVLDRLPREHLRGAVTELVHKPFDWKLVGFGSASLRSAMRNEAIVGSLIAPMLLPRFRRLLQVQFPLELRLDTPARAACAGFWYLHGGELVKAAEAFAVVRPLPGGEELYLIATSLAAALEAEDAAALGRWLEASTGLTELPEPYLRPAVVRTLHRLREVAAEADLAVHAVSPLMRSSAIGRAVAALTQLLADVEETCPQPECAIVKTVAERWRDVLASAGGQIGEEVLRQPVENPYEGYSGLPVERTFVGREKVLTRLERLWAASLDAPLPPIILYGHRRMGKTSIIHHL
ncbi:MAG: ATP-binding protein, partial [Anaerolineae bacterium]|nr:ATP-binding protein [Anaerolineae bacterium]